MMSVACGLYYLSDLGVVVGFVPFFGDVFTNLGSLLYSFYRFFDELLLF